MEQPITGFRRDDDGDWIAELACGHNQHVRHRPPFQERSWVLSEEARAGRMGTPLSCPLCDRAELPTNLRLARTGPEWNERTMPAGLRRDHRLASGTWGRIVLSDGRLRLTMATVPPLEAELAGCGATHAIPPGVEHAVEALGAVRFSIEFLAVDRGAPPSAEGGDPACWAARLCPECGVVLDGSAHRPGCPVGSPG